MSDVRKSYFGKYRGTVVNNDDPEHRGRLQCTVPDVLGPVESSWCEACAPLAGPLPMGVYFVPPIETAVWVEFEQGDPNKPIWTGCRFAIGDPPALAHAGLRDSPNMVLQTLGQNTLAVSDAPGPEGGIMLISRSGATLTVNDIGISIQNGKGAMITLVGKVIDINQGALTIT
jgi:uncharacterized protein involved in type VI secretion and phage assembly